MKSQSKKFHIHSRLQSLPFAVAGLKDMLVNQHNAWIHAAASIAAAGLGLWLRLNRVKMSLIVLAIISVWVAEAFNTVFEVLMDMLSPQYSHEIKRAKDIAAAAVLIACLGAVIVGLILLGPPLVSVVRA